MDRPQATNAGNPQQGSGYYSKVFWDRQFARVAEIGGLACGGVGTGGQICAIIS